MELVSGNIFVRPIVFEKAGEIIKGHAHNFSHVTYVRRGAVRFEKLGADDAVVKTVDKRASDGYNFLLIEAGIKHRLTALEDNSACDCIYSHRNPQGEVVEHYDGWSPGYV